MPISLAACLLIASSPWTIAEPAAAQSEDQVAATVDAFVDLRYKARESGADMGLIVLKSLGISDAAALEDALRSRRADYPGLAECAGKTTTHPVDCYHVDYSSEFVMYVPKDYSPEKFYALVVVGHGGNSSMSAERAMKTAKQYLSLYAPKICKTMDAIVVAPASERGWGPIGYSLIFSTISAVKRMTAIDPDRVYVTGQSMGGHLAYRAALLFPDAFGAVSPHSGGYDFAEKGSIGNLINVPGRAVFGSQEPYGINGDNKKNEVWGDAHGLEWSFIEKNGGHTIYQDELGPMATFFDEHPRDSYPARTYLKHGGKMLFEKTWAIKGWPEHFVRSEERPLRWNRKHWLEVTPRTDTKEPQEIYAVNEGDNRFTVTASQVRSLRFYLHPDMIDFEKPVTVTVNGEEAFKGLAAVDMTVMLDDACLFDDRGRTYWGKIDFDVTTDKVVTVPLTK